MIKMRAIDRLRITLNNANLDYENLNVSWMERVAIPSYAERKISIIQGDDSVGNEQDLLEVWVKGDEEPMGNLSVHDVWDIIEQVML